MQIEFENIRFSFGFNKFDNHPINHALSWTDFGDFINTHKAAYKGLNYITSPFGEDGRRCKANAEPRAWIAFDMDGDLSNSKCIELLSFFKNLRCYFYETASSFENSRRVRIILACDREINESESKSIGEYLISLAPTNDGWDKSTFHCSQPVFLPPINKTLLSFDGGLLPVNKVLEQIPKPPLKKFSRPRKFLKSPNVYDFFARNGLILKGANLGSFDVICPWANEHTGTDISGSVYFLPSAENKHIGGFKCQHSHCESRNINHIFKLLETK